MAKLPPVPFKAKLLDQIGLLTPVWSDWFKQAFVRMGGHEAQTNSELESYVDNTVDTSVWNLETSLQPLLVPTGAVLPFGGSSAPAGFLLCNGAAVSRTTYADLFAVIGTTYGVGDGSTTFNLPPEGVFPVNKEASGAFQTLGGTGGAESAPLPSHSHSVSLTTGGPSATEAMNPGGEAVASSGHSHTVSGNTGNPNSTPTIATIPPFVVFNFIIKT